MPLTAFQSAKQAPDASSLVADSSGQAQYRGLVDGVLVAGDPNPRALALDALPGTPLGNGDKVVANDQHYMLWKIAASLTTAEVLFFGKVTVEMPPTLMKIDYRFVRAIASLWKQKEAVKVS